MNKLLLDLDSFQFISDWYMDNQIIINNVPEVLHRYRLVWTEKQDFSIECDFEWVNGENFNGKAVMHKYNEAEPLKVSFSVNISPDLLQKLRDSILSEYGKVETEYRALNFAVGVHVDSDEESPSYEYKERLAKLMAHIHIYVSYFLANYQPEISEYMSERRETVTQSKKKKKKSASKSTNVTYINVTKYIQDVKSGEKKLPRHNKKCQYAFDVRGHYRHYKNGKTVWIASHTRNTLEKRRQRDKTYKLNLKKGDKKC